MLAPTRLRTAWRWRGMPEWVQPTTQSNSGGNQPGRRSPSSGARCRRRRARRGRRRRRRAARSSPARRSRRRRGRRRPRRSHSATPLLRAPERPCCSRLATTLASGQRSRQLASSSGAWSITRTISCGATVWAAQRLDRRRRAARAARRCRRRSRPRSSGGLARSALARAVLRLATAVDSCATRANGRRTGRLGWRDADPDARSVVLAGCRRRGADSRGPQRRAGRGAATRSRVATLRQPLGEPPPRSDGVAVHLLASSVHRIPGVPVDEERRYAPPAPDPLDGPRPAPGRCARPARRRPRPQLAGPLLPAAGPALPAPPSSSRCTTTAWSARPSASSTRAASAAGPALRKCLAHSVELLRRRPRGRWSPPGPALSEPWLRRRVDMFLPVSDGGPRALRARAPGPHRVVPNFIGELPPPPPADDPRLAALPRGALHPLLRRRHRGQGGAAAWSRPTPAWSDRRRWS